MMKRCKATKTHIPRQTSAVLTVVNICRAARPRSTFPSETTKPGVPRQVNITLRCGQTASGKVNIFKVGPEF